MNAISPSLLAGERSSFELKFMIASAQLPALLDWARKHMAPDPYGNPLDGSYRTTTLYFDTPDFRLARRELSKEPRYRIRRYGNSGCAFTERKLRRNSRVTKFRTALAVEDLASLPTEDQWFSNEVSERALEPKCLVQYTRSAYFADAGDEPIRLTIDRLLSARDHTDWSIPSGLSPSTFVPFLKDHAIVELKFQSAMPGLFRDLIAEFALVTANVSKYRAAQEARGQSQGDAACKIG